MTVIERTLMHDIDVQLKFPMLRNSCPCLQRWRVCQVQLPPLIHDKVTRWRSY